MATCRVMAVFQGGSNLPEDRFINTFHFADVGPAGEPYFAQCRSSVINFFSTESTGVSIGGLLSPYVSRTATVQSYDLDVPEGEREPTVETFTLASTGASGGLPEEVAVVLSLKGAPPDTPRRRGRLYLGPFIDGGFVITPATTTQPARPTLTGVQSLGTVVSDRAAELANTGPTFPTWCIRSVTPAENFVVIEGGYIDNAFDTQRRRGPETTDRILWAANP